MWRKTMTYLGLGPDEEYEDEGYYDDPVDPSPRPSAPQTRPPQVGLGPRVVPTPQTDDSDVRVVPASAVRTFAPEQVSPVRATPIDDGPPAMDSLGPTVRPMPSPARTRPHVVSPTSFDDAMDIGNAFKQGLPVIMNLGGADRDLARRLIDFASGVVFAREGSMERVAPQVYLITPTDVEVSDDDRRRLQERGLHR
jgi:cell division inhibitor SepF